MMSDYLSDRDRDDELMAIPRLAEQVGVTPRVLRYWEEQQLISPTREHGKLRYSPRDLAIAALIRILLEGGAGVEGLRMLKRLAERDIRRAAGDQAALAEEALRILYQRKAFAEETGTAEEHYLQPRPQPQPPPHRPPPPDRPPPRGPRPGGRPGRP